MGMNPACRTGLANVPGQQPVSLHRDRASPEAVHDVGKDQPAMREDLFPGPRIAQKRAAALRQDVLIAGQNLGPVGLQARCQGPVPVGADDLGHRILLDNR